MDFFDFLWELAKKGWDIFSYIWSLDYSFVHEEILGISIMNLASFFIGVLAFWEFCKWLFGSLGGVLEKVFHLSFSKVFNWLFQASMHVLHRCLVTLNYVQSIPYIQQKKDNISIKLKAFRQEKMDALQRKISRGLFY